MKRKNKQLKCIFVVSVLIISLVVPSITVYGSDGNQKVQGVDLFLNQVEAEYYGMVDSNEEKAAISEIVSIYRNDPMFNLDYSDNQIEAENMVRIILSNLFQMQPKWGSSGNCGASGTPIMSQVQTNSCGAASAVQVITGKGYSYNIPGLNYSDKERTLIPQTSINSVGYAYVYEVRNLINKYIGSGQYGYIECTNLTKTQFINYVESSFLKDGAVILHAIPKYLDYYPSDKTTGHYVTGIYIASGSDKFQTNDCHYDSAFNGIHGVSLTNAYNSVHAVAGRYLIYQIQ